MSTHLPSRTTLRISILCLAFALMRTEASEDCGIPPEIIPGGTAVEGRLLVKFKPGMSETAIAALNKSVGARIDRTFRHAPDLKLVSLPPGMTVEDGVRWFSHRPEVSRAEPDAIFEIDLVPTDFQFGDQWGLHNSGQSSGLVDFDVDAPEAWDLVSDSPSVVIGSIDTGVNLSHPDLSSIWTNPGEVAGNGIDDDGNGYVDDVNGYDFVNDDGLPLDDNSHGTHVMGIAAASGNNGFGVAGVTWNARIMALKVCNACGRCACSDIVAAVDYATNEGARVTNNSYGGTLACAGLDEAIGRAEAAGILFVAAAGNSTSDNDNVHIYPAGFDHDNIIAVASTARDGTLSAFSNFGASSVDLGAPGSEILSTIPRNENEEIFGVKSGTSMAAPFVTGAIALLMGFGPSMSMEEYRDAILGTTVPSAALAGKTVTGGMLNVRNALVSLIPPGNDPPVAVTGGPYTGTAGAAVLFNASGSFDPDAGDAVFDYTWSFGDGASVTTSAPTIQHTYAIKGTYTVTLMVRDTYRTPSAVASTTCTVRKH